MLDLQLAPGGPEALRALQAATEAAQTAPRERVDRLLASIRSAEAVFPPKAWVTPELRKALRDARLAVVQSRVKRFGLKNKKPKDLLALDDQQVVWSAISLAWDVAVIHEGRARLTQSLEQATCLQRAIYGAWWTETEVGNGGFHQYFWNSTGVVSALAQEGFGAMGAARMRECLAKAVMRLGSIDVFDRAARQQALAEIRPDAFGELDERFSSATATEYLPRAAQLIRREWIEFFD
jgi:hypothetical protein